MGLHTHGLNEGHLDFYHRYFSQLVGATIEEFIFAHDKDEDEYWPTFKVKLADGSRLEIEISQDEEGNGPGWISGLPSVHPADIGAST